MSRRKLISFHMVSLDGYHEDARRSLDWAAIDEEFDEHSISQLNDMGGLVFGRRTYEGMVSYWTGPGATDSPEIARRMTVLPKVVVSTTLTDPGWENTRVLGDRIAEEIAAMKEVDGDGKDLAVFGSSTLTASLLDEGLVDEVRVVVLPVLLGAGSTLLAGGHGGEGARAGPGDDVPLGQRPRLLPPGDLRCSRATPAAGHPPGSYACAVSLRRWQLAAAVAALLAGPIVAAAATGTLAPLTALAASAAVAALVAGLAAGGPGRRTAGLALGGAAGVSLATTAAVVTGGGASVRSAAGLSTQVEAVAILVLTAVAARYAPLRHAVAGAGLAAAGLGMTVWRFASSGGERVTLVGMAAWAAVGALAGAVGLHLRGLDERRVRSVAEARREQRLHLAGDLHDFVAHDVSEMLAQAQAGQVVAAEHPRCRETFAKIDEAAQRALRSLDQTVQMLHAVSPRDGAPRDAPPGSGPALPDVAELADRFADASGVAAAVDLGDLSGDDLRRLPHELSATLYRVAVEALTNVRRHAPAARTVRVEIGRRTLPGGAAAIELSVENDDGGGPPATPAAVSRRNGLGLATLSERVQRLGGRFSAGPCEPSGWRVTAAVPTVSERRAPR